MPFWRRATITRRDALLTFTLASSHSISAMKNSDSFAKGTDSFARDIDFPLGDSVRGIPFERVVILHGYGATPADHWFPWLTRAVPGAEAVELPRPHSPEAASWILAATDAIGPLSRKTAVVTHSLGGLAALRAIQRLVKRGAAQARARGGASCDAQLGALVAVAPFACELPLAGDDDVDRFILSQLPNFLSKNPFPNPRVFGRATVIRSDDDPFVPAGSSEEFAARIGANTLTVHGAGHFLASDGVTELPEVLEALSAA